MLASRTMDCLELLQARSLSLRLTGAIRAVILLGALALVGCGEPNPAAPVLPGSTPSAQYNLNLDMQNLMNLVVEPVADTLWDTAGWILSDAGYEELYPTTDEGWQFAYNQSAMIVEIGNMLALPGRVQGDTWLRYAQATSEVGEAAMRATAAQDKEAYFQAGAQLYSVCTACHQAYNPEITNRFISN